MNLFEAKKKLSILWFTFAAVLFLIVLIQSLLGKYEDKINEAWGWFFPNILPTLSLMISVFLFDLKNKKTNYGIEILYFRISYGLSVVYLITILLTILIEPLSPKSIIQIMKESNLYLGPLQGLVAGAIGLLFVKSK